MSPRITCVEALLQRQVILGDMPVAVLGIEGLGQFVAQDYLPLKKSLNAEWFKVGHAELPGASDQIITEVNRAAPIFASGIMNEYRRFAIGALEWRRDLSIEAAAHLLRYGRHFDEAGMPAIFGAAAEDVADLAIEAHVRDPQVSFRLAQQLVRNLLELIPNARPIGLNGLFKAVAKLACWSMASDEKDITQVLLEGIAASPPDFVDAALSRMESMQSGLC